MPSHSCCTSTHSVSIVVAEGFQQVDLEALQFVVLVDEVEGRIGAFDGDADGGSRCGPMPATPVADRRRGSDTAAASARYAARSAQWSILSTQRYSPKARACQSSRKPIPAGVGTLPACHAHVAAQSRPGVAAVDDEIVTLGLSRNGVDDDLPEARSSSEARTGARRSAASSWPRHMKSWPVQVSLTRLQLSQKLCVIGVMKPSRPPVSATPT